MRLISILFCLLANTLQAQYFEWATQIGGDASDGINVMTTNTQNEIIVGGTYIASSNANIETLPDYGGADIFIAKVDMAGELLWINGAGSEDDDEIIDLVVDENNDIYALGNYWIEATFDTIILNATNGSRAIFLTKYNENGQVLWVKNISSNGAKSAAALALDANQNVVLTGYFGDTLFIENETWTAQADLDLFICKLTPDGDLIWLNQAGQEGDIKPLSMVVDPNNDDIAIGGVMFGTLAIAQDTFQNNTNDLDVFLVKFDSNGAPLWGRKAGGVFRDNHTAMAVDEVGDLYLTGDFRGVIKLDENLSIETSGILDENFYVLKYAADGTPLWGRSLGSAASEFSKDIVVENGRVSLIGYFLGTMMIDEAEVSAGTQFDTFLAGFETEAGQLIWLSTIKGEDAVLGNQLAVIEDGFVAAGSFRASMYVNDEDLESNGQYDGFVSLINSAVTPTQNLITADPINIYPNPTRGNLIIETDLMNFKIKILDAFGRRVVTVENEKQLDLSAYPPGIYFLQIYDANRFLRTQRIIISSF